MNCFISRNVLIVFFSQYGCKRMILKDCYCIIYYYYNPSVSIFITSKHNTWSCPEGYPVESKSWIHLLAYVSKHWKIHALVLIQNVVVAFYLVYMSENIQIPLKAKETTYCGLAGPIVSTYVRRHYISYCQDAWQFPKWHACII